MLRIAALVPFTSYMKKIRIAARNGASGVVRRTGDYKEFQISARQKKRLGFSHTS